MTSWREISHPARLEEILPGGAVKCHLSPRNCVIKEGRQGFCGVRANRGGRLVSLNYGKAVHATEELFDQDRRFDLFILVPCGMRLGRLGGFDQPAPVKLF